MEELIQQLKIILANTVAFGMKAQQYHWNIEGKDFPQHHLFFQKLYEEVNGAVDILGEQIRTLDAYAPLSPSRIAELTSIIDNDTAPEVMVMYSNLFEDNNKILNSLVEGYILAERYSEFGISNIIQDRITSHKGHLYMIRSILRDK